MFNVSSTIFEVMTTVYDVRNCELCRAQTQYSFAPPSMMHVVMMRYITDRQTGEMDMMRDRQHGGEVGNKNE